MIEWRPLVANSVVGERLQKLDDLGPILLIETNVPNPRAEIAAGRDVAVPAVELDHLFECRGAAGMEVRTGELHVAKARRLECAVGMFIRCRWEQRRSKRVQSGRSRVVLVHTHAGSEEPECARIERI